MINQEKKYFITNIENNNEIKQLKQKCIHVKNCKYLGAHINSNIDYIKTIFLLDQTMITNSSGFIK
jgi:hypothetical protein